MSAGISGLFSLWLNDMAERSQLINELILSALNQDPAERARFVREVCRQDEALLAEVEAYLASHEKTETQVVTQRGAVKSLPLASELVGRSIGPYRILRRIGHGGMGDVYLAVRADKLYQKVVAIKIVRTGPGSEDTLRRFSKERQTLAILDHPNIVKLIDGGTTPDGLPYLVMDYVEGTPIDEYCDTHKLTITERLQLFRPVCAALNYAHQNLIVHRDIKPSNILVSEDGVPKLLDFGIAKLLKPEFSSDTISLTSPDLRPMTLAYASPEQLRGQPITTASDIYSLGVLLYRLLTGHQPYDVKTSTALELDRVICEQEPEKPSSIVTRIEATTTKQPRSPLTPQSVSASREGAPEKLRRRLTGELDTIVLMALRKEPQRRYASMEQFSQDILRHLEGRRVIACKDTFRYRSTKFIRRNRTGVAAVALIFLALVIGIIGTLSQARVAKVQRATAERRFNDVRELAHFVLFDFDGAIRSGPTPARKLLISRALDYLNRLSAESADDSALQKELIEGYFKVGDVQGNLYGPNLGDAKGAKESYRKALQTAEKLPHYASNSTETARYLAVANEKLGDLTLGTGDMTEALRQYQKAQSEFEALSKLNPAKPELKLDVVKICQKVSFTEYRLGNLDVSLQGYRGCLQIGEDLLAGNFSNTELLRSIADGTLSSGEVLAMSGRPGTEGLEKIRSALDMYRRLLAENPDHAQARHDLWKAYTISGEVLEHTGKNAEAAQEMREGLGVMEKLVNEDPHNKRSQTGLSLALGYLAELSLKTGQKEEAHVLQKRALRILRTLADSPDAFPNDHKNYAWYLVTTPFADLQNSRDAQQHAEIAVKLTNGTDFAAWDTLARAYAVTGELQRAVESDQKALALLPATPTHDRKEVEANLLEYKNKLTRNPAPAHSQ